MQKNEKKRKNPAKKRPVKPGWQNSKEDINGKDKSSNIYIKHTGRTSEVPHITKEKFFSFHSKVQNSKSELFDDKNKKKIELLTQARRELCWSNKKGPTNCGVHWIVKI